jgi:murein DD-endopeptidase MepM/ murein hydrolase activator NlpD
MATPQKFRRAAIRALSSQIEEAGNSPIGDNDFVLSAALRQISDLPPIPPGTKNPYANLFSWLKAQPSQPPATNLFPAGFVVPEVQLRAPNYPTVTSPALGKIIFTGGFMEPHGHSWKPVTRAIFADRKLRDLPASDRNLGIDYYVDDLQIRVWLPGQVTRVALEGGYGHRCHIRTDLTYRFNSKDYPVLTAYAHAKSFRVKVGDRVTVGQAIGIMGGTGAGGEEVYPPHVDLRIWIDVDGRAIDLSPNLFLGAPPQTETRRRQVFDMALQFTLKWEGGFVDDPDDLGGRTNRGVTQATYDRWRASQNLKPKDVKTITQQEAHDIYRQKYWRWESRTDQMCDALEVADFDTCVNFGVAGATMFLQEIFGLQMDGIFGPKTLAAVLANNNKDSAIRLVQARIRYRHQRVRENPSQKEFLQGWLNRDNDLLKLVESL